jgi:hypothetical protein
MRWPTNSPSAPPLIRRWSMGRALVIVARVEADEVGLPAESTALTGLPQVSTEVVMVLMT